MSSRCWRDGVSLSVFHGVRPEDMEIARASRARPVLNSAAQIARWKEAGGGPCDVMVDTGMNRLGLSLDGLDMGLFDGLEIDTLMSHLVSAEDDHHLNDIQLMLFRDMAAKVKAMRYSLWPTAQASAAARISRSTSPAPASRYMAARRRSIANSIFRRS
jgi:alanine racemase